MVHAESGALNRNIFIPMGKGFHDPAEFQSRVLPLRNDSKFFPLIRSIFLPRL